MTAGGEPVIVDLAASPRAERRRSRSRSSADAAAAWSTRHGAFVVSAVAAAGAGSPTPALWTIAPSGQFAVVPGTDGAVGPVGVGPDGSVAAHARGAPENRRPASGCCRGPRTDMTRHAPSPAFDDRWPAFSPDGGAVLIGRTFVVRPRDGDGIWLVDLGVRGGEAAHHGRCLRALAALSAVPARRRRTVPGARPAWVGGLVGFDPPERPLIHSAAA